MTEETPAQPNIGEDLHLGGAATITADGADQGETIEEEPQIDPLGRLVDLQDGKFHWGTGRRKNAVARVRVRPGTGEFTINGRPLNEFFARDVDRSACLAPLVSLKVRKKVDVAVNAHGGGNTGQAGAVRMRPVLLTAGTTLLGNLIITLDPVFSGLALAIIFGIVASTLFTLIVVPVVYLLVFDRPEPDGVKL